MLTLEQQKIVDEVCSSNNNNRIIAVNAIAGSGKTSTAEAVIKTYNPSNGFYTAFNKAIVEDSSKRFGKLLDCRTIHSLAYKYVKPRKQIEDITFNTIKESLTYEIKQEIINTIDDFYRSSYTDIDEYIDNQNIEDIVADNVVKYVDLMCDGKIPPTFNFLLKSLHLMLLENQIEIKKDLLILDECQDTTAVTLEIFKLITADTKLILGDKFQNIYSFMNTVNAFELLKNLNILKLTQSFRCNKQIAYYVEKFGKNYLDENFSYKGNPKLNVNTNTVAYISRTNSSLINRMYSLLAKGKSFTLTRSINEIFALPIALYNAAHGNKVYDKKYKYLETEYNLYNEANFRGSFYDYIDEKISNAPLNCAIKILKKFSEKRVNIYELKNSIQNLKPDYNTILTTAHAFKGLEADTVILEEDLNSRVDEIRTKIHLNFEPNLMSLEHYRREFLTKEEREELNTYYVALSRARTKLENTIYN